MQAINSWMITNHQSKLLKVIAKICLGEESKLKTYSTTSFTEPFGEKNLLIHFELIQADFSLVAQQLTS